jgi:hypothetical protein
VSRARLLPLLLAGVLSAGCAGPERPLSIGFREVPSDVVLGAQSTPSPVAPAPAPSLLPGLALPPPPSVVALPPPTFEVRDPGASRPIPVPAPTSSPCLAADPLQAPALEAPASVPVPPAEAAYLFRNVGSFEVSGADARRGTFPATSLRTVDLLTISEDGTLFDFSVAETLGDITTTTTYRVHQATSPLPAAAGGAGLYVLRVESTRGDGSRTVFAPAPALQLAALPLQRGAVVEARGVDPLTATTMSFTSSVTGKARVDACGEPLDSWTLELTDGRLISPTQDLEFASTYAVGTQFGGIVLQETTAFAGTDDGAGVSRTNTSTISQVPRTGQLP